MSTHGDHWMSSTFQTYIALKSGIRIVIVIVVVIISQRRFRAGARSHCSKDEEIGRIVGRKKQIINK
jgi:hypothetical protein